MVGMDMPGMTAPPSSTPMPPHHHGAMGMHMTFFWGTHVQILFSGWPGDRGLAMYVLALLAVAAAAALLESLSSVSARLSRRTTHPLSGLVLTLLHALQMLLAYLVMLAVMSFNAGVLAAAVAGHALGFLLLGSGVFKWSPRRAAPAAGSEDQHAAHAHAHAHLHAAKY